MCDYSLENVLKLTKNRKPDFNNLLAVLNNKTPSRPTLFEFFMNMPLALKLAQWEGPQATMEEHYNCIIKTFRNAGYDYATIHASNFGFKANEVHTKASVSANDGSIIHDRAGFEAYEWENPSDYYDGLLDRIEKFLPDGMKFIVAGPGGVLENVIRLVGFDNLCYMLADDPELVKMIVDNVGKRLLEYYELIATHNSVGAIISNDDWGFNTQTMLSTEDMRKYVFPWHKKIAETAHNAGKYAILHSCGRLYDVYDDIIDDMKFDGKHSYEDNIQPVEEAYDMLKGKIAVLGGIDMDYVCRMPQDEIFNRCTAMLKKTNCEGYALGTGNSVPEYLPDENYFAMILAALTE